MKNKLFIVILLVISIFVVGCTKEEKKNDSSGAAGDVVAKKVSCSTKGVLFHSMHSLEYIVSLDSNNRLLEYIKIDKYYDFDSDENFNMICEGAPEEAENNNKMYSYLKETADCNKETKVVTVTDLYDMSKIDDKKYISTQFIVDYLDNSLYTFDLEGFKRTITGRGYTCVEK